MTQGIAVLDDLFDAFEDLRDVLDGVDAPAIERASERVGRAAAAVRSIGAWHSDPQLIARLNALLPLIDSARMRVKLLADHASQRLSLLAAHGATQAPLTYGR